jgi:hypothetical protein
MKVQRYVLKPHKSKHLSDIKHTRTIWSPAVQDISEESKSSIIDFKINHTTNDSNKQWSDS